MENKNINTRIDWITTIACIGSGLIVYLGYLKGDIKLQTGAYMILTGWIIAFIGQVLSVKNMAYSNCPTDDDFRTDDDFGTVDDEYKKLEREKNKKIASAVITIIVVVASIVVMCNE